MSLSLSVPPTTTKSWTEVINYNETYKQPAHRTYNTKRKREEELRANQEPQNLEVPQVAKVYNASEASRKCYRDWYYRHRTEILDKQQLKNNNKRSTQAVSPSTLIPTAVPAAVTTDYTQRPNKRKLESLPTTTSSITYYFTKKIKTNNDEKPP